MNKFFGYAGMTLSIGLILFGLPAQMWKNYQLGSVDGLSVWLMVFMSLIYFVWAAYAWTKKPIDYFLAIPQSFGFLVSLMMWVQWVYYKMQS